MLYYSLRRILAFIPALFITLTLIFIITRTLPGSPVSTLLGGQSVNSATLDEISRQLGYDRPILVQYIEWLPNILTGDLGQSMFFKKSVSEVLLQRFPVTLSLTLFALILTILIGVPLGVLSAIKRGSFLDYLGNVLSSIGMAVPPFWLGFMLILIFAVEMKWLPSSGYRPPEMGLWQWFSRLILPTIALSLSQIGLLVRMTRSTMLEVLEAEYVGMARAKGMPEYIVIIRHALRNAMVQIITAIGLLFALGLGGSVIIEQVFALPGLGELITTAAIRRDYPMLEGGILYLTLAALLVNLLVDISYAYFNPRVTLR
ncbi:ABC transporter permease [Pararhizobium sp. IMCC21322]|uniref:ABC transporter permease n=1 Tax=Pararhizobium sp. IMCC21322 TaxID=3067903 RepID=UPI00274187BE|nr:ABC transporter permease [Pararhizobium sp. IMCC21322]